jgi:hypothetical protein
MTFPTEWKSKSHVPNPLVNIQLAIEHGPVEIVDLPFIMVDLSIVFSMFTGG